MGIFKVTFDDPFLVPVLFPCAGVGGHKLTSVCQRDAGTMSKSCRETPKKMEKGWKLGKI
jgi:hypothetical protein